MCKAHNAAKAYYTKRKRLAWNGSNEAQRQADAAYAKLRPKAKPAKQSKKAAKRRAAKLRRKQRQLGIEPPKVRPDYYEYINSYAWTKKRRQALKHYGHKCAICKATESLQVHHKTYVNLGWEPMEDLQVLCEGCHQNSHECDGVADPLTREYLSMRF